MIKSDAWLSILGLYKYDNSIFEDLTLPSASELDLTLPYMQETVEDLSKDTLIFKILMDLAELPLVYTDPDMIKYMIARWSSARTPIWRELWKTTLYKYVPIWNKDGVVEETRSLETSGTSEGTLKDRTADGHTVTGSHDRSIVTDQDTTERKSGERTDDHDVETVTDQDTSESRTGTNNVTTVTDQNTSKSGQTSGTGSLNRTVSHNVTGFDVDTYAPDTQDVTAETTSTSGTSSETGTNDITETVTGRTTDTGTGTNDVTETVDEQTSSTWSESTTGTNDVEVTDSGTTEETRSATGSLDRTTDSETSGTEEETIRRVEQGNIGVTTTQQMIREQREIVLLDMYQVITDEFKKQFCIMVY